MTPGGCRSKSVAVIGCGGLGCNVLVHLAGAGIGKLYLCDFDVIAESNLDRQFLYKQADVGALKCERAAAFLHDYAPDVKTVTVDKKVTADTDLTFASSCAAVVLAVDNNEARRAAQAFCAGTGIPLVNGGVRSGFGTAYLYLPGESPCLSCAGLLETENTPERVNSATVGVIGALCAEITVAVLSGDRSAAGNLYIYDDFEIKKLKIRPERTCSCR